MRCIQFCLLLIAFSYYSPWFSVMHKILFWIVHYNLAMMFLWQPRLSNRSSNYWAVCVFELSWIYSAISVRLLHALLGSYIDVVWESTEFWTIFSSSHGPVLRYLLCCGVGVLSFWVYKCSWLLFPRLILLSLSDILERITLHRVS